MPRSPFGSHVAERLLDALGRHAAEGDADTSAEAEAVRSRKVCYTALVSLLMTLLCFLSNPKILGC